MTRRPHLLPCPFCGADPVIDFGLSNAPLPPGQEFINCPTVHLSKDGDFECGAYQRGIANWNRRFPQGAQP